MRVSVIKTSEEFHALKNDWNNLLSASIQPVLHLRHEWFSAWWDAYNDGKTLNIVVIADDAGEIVCIAPLMRTANASFRGIPIKKLGFMVNGVSPSANFIVRKEKIDEGVKALIKYLSQFSGWDIFEFEKMDEGEATFLVLDSHLKNSGLPYGFIDNIHSPIVQMDSDWNQFFQNKSKKFKKSLRHKINRAEKTGDIKVEKIKITGTDQPELQEMFEVSGRSWKRKNKRDLINDQESQQFYKTIAGRLGPEGVITLWILRKGTQPISFEFHLTYDGIVYPIRADYDENFRELSPGSVLEYHILKSLFETNGMRQYQTCAHLYKYLLRWSDVTKKHTNIRIFSPNPKSFSLYVLEYKIIPVLRKIKSLLRQQNRVNLGK